MRGELISDSLTMMFPIFVSVVLFASVTSGTKLRANGWPLSTFTLPFIGSTEKPATTVEHDERTSKYGIWEALQQPEEVIKFRLHRDLNKLGADNQYILNKTNAHRFHLTLPASKDSACSSFSSRRYELLFSISSDCSVAFDEASVSCENVETGQKLSVDIPGSNNWLQSSAQINCQDMHDLTKEIVDGVDYNTIEGTWARPDLVKCAISLDTWYTPKQKPWSLLGGSTAQDSICPLYLNVKAFDVGTFCDQIESVGAAKFRKSRNYNAIMPNIKDEGFDYPSCGFEFESYNYRVAFTRNRHLNEPFTDRAKTYVERYIGKGFVIYQSMGWALTADYKSIDVEVLGGNLNRKYFYDIEAVTAPFGDDEKENMQSDCRYATILQRYSRKANGRHEQDEVRGNFKGM